MEAKVLLNFIYETGITNDRYSIIYYDREDQEEFVSKVISFNATIIGGHFFEYKDYYVIYSLDDMPKGYPADVIIKRPEGDLILCYMIS